MTLEDFFTLTEMRDGLTALSRVYDLVAIMQKEKDCVVEIPGDATRQWAAVASTITATENKDCLDLFIQLDGLLFINRWLRDAQNFGNDASDGLAEESITALLRALESLQIDKEKSVSSGIWITVNSLLHHNSCRVQDRARALFNRWKQDKAGDAILHDAHSGLTVHGARVLTRECGRVECVGVNIPAPKDSADVEINAAEPSSNKIFQSKSSHLQPERVEDVQVQTHNNETDSHIILDRGNLKIENSTEEHSFIVVKGHCSEPESDAPENLSRSSDKLGATASASSKVEAGTDAASAQDIMTASSLQKNVDAKEGDTCLKATSFGDAGMPESVEKFGMDDVESSNCNTQLSKSTGKDGECCPDTLRNLSGNDGRLEKPENKGTPFLQTEDIVVANDDRDHSSDEDEDLRDESDFSRPPVDTQLSDPIDRRRSDIELEYSLVDALDVARKVAQEVEREVVEYREPSCSSSEKIMESDIRQPGSPDSIDARQDPLTEVPPEDVPTRQNQSAKAYPEEGGLINSDNLETEAEKGIHELEPSQITKVAHEPEVNTQGGPCEFDLNQEVCFDDTDHPVNNILIPISAVSSSWQAAASELPPAPVQFDGTLGWKGSAVTSAFCPASPSKILDGDRTLETGGTSNGSKPKQNFLDIDLNETEDDGNVMDFMSGTRIPVQSDPHSGESSLEGLKRSERPNLDLNCVGNYGDVPPSDLKLEGHIYSRNGHRTPSASSFSSSMQPLLRNLDLNDRPLFHNDSSDQGPYHGKSSQNASAYGGFRQGDPVISILGTRVEVGGKVQVGRKEFLHQTPLPNGKALEPVMDANIARIGYALGMVPTVSYTHSPVFAYNGLTTAPTKSSPSAMCEPGGSIPYTVPQIVGSSSAVPPYSQPPFIMSMAGGLALNGTGPPRPNLDLNSGVAIEGGGSGILKQLFMPCQGRPVEELMRANSQPPLSSGVVGKRKEPDGEWEPYSLRFKHPQPPWR